MYAMMKHDNAKALTYFERAVKERPGYAAGWYNLGYIHFQQENYPEALGNFRQASKLDTTDMKALSNLAMCYHKTGSLDSAVLTNGLIIRRKPDIVIPYINNASFYLARHDSVNAVNWLEKAVVVKPDNPRVTAVLSRYFAGKGDQTKAAYYKELHNRATGKQQE
jgi:tetratricopeptide (TPR) repeat protein